MNNEQIALDLAGIGAFELEFWHWWAIALILVVIEALTPIGIFAGMTIAATITGAVALSDPDMSWQTEVGIFVAQSVVYSFIWHKVVRRFGALSSGESTAKAKEKLGLEFTLVRPIKNGFGEAIIDDAHWELKGPDLIAGTKVRVIDVDGSILAVLPLPPDMKNSTEPHDMLAKTPEDSH